MLIKEIRGYQKTYEVAQKKNDRTIFINCCQHCRNNLFLYIHNNFLPQWFFSGCQFDFTYGIEILRHNLKP